MSSQLRMTLAVLICFIGFGTYGCGGKAGEGEISLEGVSSVVVGYDGIGPDGLKLSGPLVSITNYDDTYWLIFDEPREVLSGMYRVTGKVLSAGSQHGKWFAVSKIELIKQYTDEDQSLMLAAQWEQYDDIRELLDAGADVNVRNHNYETPLTLLIGSYGRNKGSTLEGTVESVELLIQHGADVTAGDKDDCTALHNAAIKPELTKVAQLLIDAGAPINVHTKSYRTTPLHFAVQYQSFDIAKTLLIHGADTNAINSDGGRPLDRATESVRRDLIQSMP